MGTDALGFLLYTADGRFSVTISRRGRIGFAAGDLLGGTAKEKARVVEGFVAYAGHYSFHGDRVVHHVELSLFPHLGRNRPAAVGRTQPDRLILSARPLLLAGTQQVPRLVGSDSEQDKLGFEKHNSRTASGDVAGSRAPST